MRTNNDGTMGDESTAARGKLRCTTTGRATGGQRGGRGAAIVTVLGALGLWGCPLDAPTRLDAGPGDAGPPVDAPVPIDAPIAIDDAPDAGAVTDAPCACTASEICVRGACLAACGATAAVLDAALAADLTPVAHYCRTPVAWAAVGDEVFEIATRMEGMDVHFDLSRWTATPGTSAPTPTMVGTATYSRPTAGEMVFPGGYVAVSSDRMHAVFGFTTTRAGFFGGVFDVATGGGAVVSTDAPGNFDATFVGATRFIVNGTGLGAVTGQGLYELAAGSMGGALVATGMGDASGSVAYWASEDLVVAGGASYGAPFPTGESERVFFVDPAALSSTTPADLSSAQFLALPSAFRWVPGDGLVTTVYDASFALDHLDVRWVTLDAATGAPTASTVAPLTNDDTFTTAGTIAGDIALQHAGGILVVRQID